MPVNTDLLQKGLDELGLAYDARHLERLSRYIQEIELWNPAYGLVKASGDELVVKHILDSLAAIPLMRELKLPLGTIADLGTGAGLPGIPLSILLPDAQFTLVERMEKRLRFLENQRVLLGLSNLEIANTEAERVSGPFDLVVFRAFRPFSEIKLFRAVARLAAPGGAILAYKGRADRAREELAGLSADPALGALASAARVLPLAVPFLNEERCAVVIRP